MRKNLKISFACAMVLMSMALLLSGCKSKIQADTKHVLNMAATVATEREASFKVIKSELAPVSDAFKTDFDRFVTAHEISLKATALALKTLQEAIELDAKVNKNTRKMIRESVRTEEHRLKLIDHWRKKVKAKDETKQVEVITWLEAHHATIARQVQLMHQLSGKIDRDHSEDKDKKEGE